jgi:hypothetical protein
MLKLWIAVMLLRSGMTRHMDCHHVAAQRHDAAYLLVEVSKHNPLQQETLWIAARREAVIREVVKPSALACAVEWYMHECCVLQAGAVPHITQRNSAHMQKHVRDEGRGFCNLDS